MEFRMGAEKDYTQLAELKWLHCEEDDLDYNENNLSNVSKECFIADFVKFLSEKSEYKIFVATDNDLVVSAMFIYMIPKVPRPNGNADYIAYLTNVYTRKEYRNKKIGAQLLTYIKDFLSKEKCELIFAWPSKKSTNWYNKNGFCSENEIVECELIKE